ncbi:MAG TPA: amidohydrolase family protein, partial [Myxococcota bacterium]|nr:amidohydrolase family protein [Myxococcota bacterium]
PYPVLSQGLSWKWQGFGEFLDLLASRRYDMDVLAYVPHAALRVDVMGERGIDREPASDEDLETMCALLAEALDAGAAGIATSRSLFHRSSDGRPIPTLDAADRELVALARTLREKGRGTFQIVEDLHLADASLDRIRRLARESERPLTFSIGTGNTGARMWPRLLDELTAANAEGLNVTGQVMPRAIGLMLGFELTLNPFYTTPTYLRLASLPLEQRLRELRRESVRAAILAEPVDADPALALGRAVRDFEFMFELCNPPDYEQPPERSIASRARQQGIRPEELAYDLMLRGERGDQLYLAMANFRDGRLDDVERILRHPDVVLGLGDGGAHVGTICDASYSTFALTHWARDRAHGRIGLPEVVHKMTGATARIMGLEDRGRIEVGRKADLNVIDFDRLQLEPPEVCHDLPGGGRRLVQRARGYVATVNAGRIVYRNGEPTGELPGRLVRAR